MVVGIQFCGGCNPHINRGAIAQQLEKKLRELGYEVLFNSPAEMTIFLSGCSSECACIFDRKTRPRISIAAASINGRKVAEKDIVSEVLKKLGGEGPTGQG